MEEAPTEPETMMTNILKSKFRGCLVGGLIGDCFGNRFQYDVKRSTRRVIEYFDSQKKGIGKKQGLVYTDDTALARELAESLIEYKQVDVQNLAKRFSETYFKAPQRAYGYHVIRVFKKLRENGYSDALKPAKEQFDGTGSFGNGAAMRIGPVPLLYFDNKNMVIEASKLQSLVTHTHHNGYNGAVLLGLAIQEAISIQPSDPVNKLEFLEKLYNQMSEIESNLEIQERNYCTQLNRMRTLLEKEEVTPIDDAIRELGNDVRALYSVPTAIYTFLVCQTPIEDFMMEDTFSRIVQYAISFGGDSDTIACMAGYIAGAHLGFNGIPKYLRDCCEDCDKIITLADKLYEVADTQSSNIEK